MMWHRIGLALTLGLVTPVALAGIPSSQAQDPSIVIDVLTPRSVFADDVALQIRNRPAGLPPQVLNLGDPSRVVIARITVQPGAAFPWHSHPGPVVVHVSSGELTYVRAADCEDRRYVAGTMFVDPGNAVHTAYNGSGTEAVLHATFYDAPETGALTIPAPAPADCLIGAP